MHAVCARSGSRHPSLRAHCRIHSHGDSTHLTRPLRCCSKKSNPWADPGAGGLLTFLQFSFVALLNLNQAFGLRSGNSGSAGSSAAAALADDNGKPDGASPRSGIAGVLARLPVVWKRPAAPLQHYARMTALFFAMSYLNNWAFKFNISQPLHMVFRSANLITTFSMGYAFFGKRCVRVRYGNGDAHTNEKCRGGAPRHLSVAPSYPCHRPPLLLCRYCLTHLSTILVAAATPSSSSSASFC